LKGPASPGRRAFGAAALAGLALPHLARAALDPGARILRVPFVAAETGFDPAQISDLYSATIVAHIFESLYQYDTLAVPLKITPLTAAAMPEVSADFRTWTIRVQRGIRFAGDPAFDGRRRELVAADYVYSLKRFYDPATRSPGYSSLREEGILGLEALRERALEKGGRFDYDAPVEGLRALDAHTLQIRLAASRPRFLATLASASFGAMAREVVERYGDTIMAHPVGTGPYRLGQWRRSSRIVLEKNPDFRELFYDAQPAADDAEGQAWLARFKGRRLPLNDGVEIAVIEESQPRWLSFLNGEIDFIRVPNEYALYAAPTGTLAPNLARRGIQARRYLNADSTMSYFNMEDPIVGGYGAEKVALRRAVGLAYDIEAEIRGVRRGQAIAAQAPMAPGTYGYDPDLRSANSTYDPALAKALLDTYGYVDRDGDGWRELPDGRPLVLHFATQSSQIDRQFNENWQKSLSAVGLRIAFQAAQWPENLKAARAGRLQMWSLGMSADAPDGQPALEAMYGPSAGDGNLARFRMAAFDEIYRRMLVLPDGPEREALFDQAKKLALAYMPYKFKLNRIATDMTQAWVIGYRRPVFWQEWWHYVDIDDSRRAAAKPE
jgi:ABC-type transport system substrate-binding protein